ncbi:phosphate ABC transporter permease subunit PstC [Pseudogemmobacter blasticus]|uniref:Phosphate transport system permease protein n=1 Tax=Fuscovulum blasticum DSM 2131 TaxID=1188250 RepID=A0A2T4JEG0_FUSBL|nr:phosphate ABC transporter permease subunit PstC [Fuscovulum blasticum]PTE16305.1 phosphate ABC transporter permease subunit PstC [Fuscovulum blasticum DSM 2131]
MTAFFLLVTILILALVGYILGRVRAMARAGGDARGLHSLPNYYGWHAALMTMLPALAVLILWLIVQPVVIERKVGTLLPPAALETDTAFTLAMDDVRRVAKGLDLAVANGVMTDSDASMIRTEFTDVRERLAQVGVALGSNVSKETLAAAQSYRKLTALGAVGRTIAVLAVALAGLAWALAVTGPKFRARNRVEAIIMGALVIASSIAILTTVGIIWSMLSESLAFFRQYPFTEFFFGLTWSPNFKGGSELGFVPLLWGTLYISLVSMIVAVPLGLFTAIYLAEYASPAVRAVVKPAIEVIAGIPTVVFGLFALMTVGPLLRDWIAAPMGLGNSGSSVMTAGLVIGILNIPFVSSLADDILNAVPQALRDGSYGLGATKSETVKQVVLPAALPGIMGAVLMAASRAIGETMVVAMGAGAAAKLSLNPFEAMTTMTVKIVGQLTGDTDFASPETLVAFALGLTLFVLTLGLNVVALQVVRKYKEQYE